jgi:hypothetical protein
VLLYHQRVHIHVLAQLQAGTAYSSHLLPALTAWRDIQDQIHPLVFPGVASDPAAPTYKYMTPNIQAKANRNDSLRLKNPPSAASQPL